MQFLCHPDISGQSTLTVSLTWKKNRVTVFETYPVVNYLKKIAHNLGFKGIGVYIWNKKFYHEFYGMYKLFIHTAFSKADVKK